MGIETAILGSAVLGAASTRSASRRAASAQSQAMAAQERQYQQQREDSEPWRREGANALTQLVGENGRPVTAEEVMQDPGYQFGLTQGQRALDRQFSRSGGRVSGASLMAAQRYGTDYAGTGYNAAYQRRNDRLNRLAAIAGIGQTATNASAAAGAQSANAISGLLMQGGQDQAAGRMAQGNIWGNALGDLAAMNLRRQQQQWAPSFGPTWQQRGGGMDTGNYGGGL